MRRALPLLLLVALLAAGCADDPVDGADAPSGDPTSLEAVVVGDVEGAAPTLQFDQPLAISATTRRVLEEGDGITLTEGATAVIEYVMVNARDGSVYSSSWPEAEDPDVASTPISVTMDGTVLSGVRIGLEGLNAGSRVLVAIAPVDGLGPDGGDPDYGLEADDTILLVADVLEVRQPLDRAEGVAVAPVEGQPTVELDEDGAPTITVQETAPPGELVAQLLIEGSGAVVEAGQTITVHYTGALWDTGEVFDSSWDWGSPASFEIGTGSVIPGWDEGLVGASVGSQLLLVVPPADGYPEGNGTIPAGATLVFVVDILDAHG